MSDTAAIHNTCFKCGEAGHWSSACPKYPNTAKQNATSTPSNVTSTPTTAAKRNVDGANCQNCGQTGHPSSARTNPALNPVTPFSGTRQPSRNADTVVCYKCGCTGHWSSACANAPDRVPPSGDLVSPGTGTSIVCYKCGKTGHYSSSCTVPRSEWQKSPLNFEQMRTSHNDMGPNTTPGTQQNVNRGACFKCGQTGHWTRDCPVPRSEWKNQRVPDSSVQTGQGTKFAPTPIM
jgi:Zinc knuckle